MNQALGVVDPMRVPGGDRAREAWRGLPALGQAFVVLAAIEVVARALGLFGTRLFVDLADPLSVITAFVPHDALILLPAVIAWRRRDAVEATPLVIRGAILVALVELLDAPLRGRLLISLVNGPVAMTSLVVAFGLGLADVPDGVASDTIAA